MVIIFLILGLHHFYLILVALLSTYLKRDEKTWFVYASKLNWPTGSISIFTAPMRIHVICTHVV